MSIRIGNYHAEGPFRNVRDLLTRSGVYVIPGRRNLVESWRVVDVGEAGDILNRITCHDRAPCWRGQGHAELAVAAIYTDESTRMRVERELRFQFAPPCGLM